MHVIVTGALGHIGSALIRSIPNAAVPTSFTLIDDLSTQRYSSLFGLPESVQYRLLEGYVEAVLRRESLRGADAVVHLAARTSPAESLMDPEGFTAHNLSKTRHVAALCHEVGVPLVFASSTSVYTPHDSHVDESSPTENPPSPYARCKLAEEQVIRRYFDEGLSGVILRLGTIFGPSPGMRFHTAVNAFCWRAATGVPLQVWRSSLDQVRPYLAVSDAANAIHACISQGIFPSSIVNASSCDATVRDVVDAINAAGFPAAIQLVDSPLMTETSYRTSTAKAQHLGLEFTGQLAEGVAQTLQLLRGLRSGTGPYTTLAG